MTASEPALEPLLAPRDGVPELITTPEQLAKLVIDLRNGTGPVAVDAERASGYRYSQRAYLVQLRRAGTGTALIDPIALPDLSEITEVLRGETWLLHAASQDLACLAEVGLHPDTLFDTELAGRLLGYERVGLAAMVGNLLGLGLAKEHSAADWSTRPLPESWLRYAALDVEVLIELHEILRAELAEAGKLPWAEQEFEAIRTAGPPQPRVDPWRRTSGIQNVRTPHGLAVVRELWQERDRIARARDTTPGRVLADRAIIAAAVALPDQITKLTELPEFAGRGQRSRARTWFTAISRAKSLGAEELPKRHRPVAGPPNPRVWADRDPAAAARLTAAREVMAKLSEAHRVPVENLLQPDLLRRVAWEPPQLSSDAISAALAAGGARPWQVDLVTGPLLTAWLTAPVADPPPPEAEPPN